MRPTLWTGPFSCTCGYRANAEVFGRRGHRYDELEVVEVEDDHQPTEEELAMEKHIHETYDGEARGVLDVLVCPKCGKRPGMSRELRRLSLWFLVLAIMTSIVSLVLFLTHEPPFVVKAPFLAAAIAIVARFYVFVAAVLEASDRVKLTE